MARSNMITKNIDYSKCTEAKEDTNLPNFTSNMS